MQIALLGPLEVRDDAGAAVAVSGGRLRALLTRLALDAGRPVRVAELVDAVWADDPPADAANALQTLVSRLRRPLGSDVVVQSAAGYRLAVDPDDVDVLRFEMLAADGAAAVRAGDPSAAADLLSQAELLWRGAPLADLNADDLATATRLARLDDVHAGVRADRAAAALDLGDAAAAVTDLEVLAAERPLDERVAGLLMRALAAAGRTADALGAFERLRAGLADELGVDPSAPVRELHLDLLRGTGPAAPPTRTVRRTNLPAQLTSFVGRDDDVARIVKALEESRLVTLTGPGGAGKTRLATEAGSRMLDTAPDGVWLVELAQVTGPGDVPQAVLGSVDLREVLPFERTSNRPSVRDATTRLLDGLVDRRAVIVLDNCEHVVDAAAHLSDTLLAGCPELRVLATSREPLAIVGESIVAVPPLGQPQPGTPAVDALAYPAVRLFADRAAASLPGFEVDDTTVDDVVQIVRRLDGLPLAIELAAARLRTLPLPDIAARLGDRFRLLTGGSRTALPRHRTLRAVVAWSWELLDDTERRVAEQLSVFPAGVTAQSAAAVTGLPEAEIEDVLAALIDKSLLVPQRDGRMRMLETIREYGIDQLAERGELGAVRTRHADHFGELLADAEPKLITRDQLPWFALLSDERENIVAALRFRCEENDADAALRMVITLAMHATMLGRPGDIAEWSKLALAVPGAADENLRLAVRGLAALGRASTMESPQSGEGYRAELAELVDEFDRAPRMENPLLALLLPGLAFFVSDDTERAGRLLAEGRNAAGAWERAAAAMLAAMLAENDGEIAKMRADLDAALAGFREIGERWGLAGTLRNVGALLTLDGRLDEAADAYEEARTLAAELDSRDDETFLLCRLADLALRRGDLDAARSYVAEGLEMSEQNGEPMESVFVMAALAAVDYRSGDLEAAREHVRVANERIDSYPREHPGQGHVRAVMYSVSALVALHDGCVDEAGRLVADAFEAGIGTNDMPIVATTGVAHATLTAHGGDGRAAAEMLGAAARLRGGADHTAHDIAELTARLRDELGDAPFETAFAQGEALDREAAIERLRPA